MAKNIFITFCFLIILIPFVNAQTDDSAFNAFWSKFKNAILLDDAETAADLTNFPYFVYGNIRNDNKTMEYDRNGFIANFKAMFLFKEHIDKIKYNQEVTIKGEDINVVLKLWKDDNKDYILSIIYDFVELGMGYDDYTFSKINGEYKLKQLIMKDKKN
jgi:hypothetical protein